MFCKNILKNLQKRIDEHRKVCYYRIKLREASSQERKQKEKENKIMKNLKQLCAISYSVQEQRKNRIKKAGLWEEYKNSKYTSVAWFLRSIGRYDLY